MDNENASDSPWLDDQRLASLVRFYTSAKANPESYTDERFLQEIRSAFWGTNAWAYAKATLVIVAPGCLMRPHLTMSLLRAPLEALYAAGLVNPSDIIPFGIDIAHSVEPYLSPTEEGRRWLLEKFSTMENQVTALFNDIVSGEEQ